MPRNESIRKTLVIGSGPIVIGQAAEFDYAGAQACRVLRQAGVNVVLVNSNPATIMTDRALADEIYLEPLTAETVKRIIRKERPDSLLAGLGGQTGLNLSMQLYHEGFLQQMGVRLIGTNVEAIDKAEDRELFKETMALIGQPTIPSDIAQNVEQALTAASRIGYPVIVRPAFTLGGAGGGVAQTAQELRGIAQGGLDASPIRQILVEKYIYGWKEIEFETMRDAAGNVIAVCSMENFDPVGVHTGDSIVVAPALTLSDKEYQLLRSASLDIISALGIVGGCNCQFALNPESFDYAVIEVNPRVSRSSALASKATGYPIAKITTQIALGYTLDEICNDITGKTCACFEPTLDYVVVKLPKWPFDKFPGVSRKLGTQMKATGEVMAIGQSFEEALMKAVRGAELSLDSLNAPPCDSSPVTERLERMDDRRLFTIFEALKSGVSVETIHKKTRIDRWFLWRLENLARFEQAFRGDEDYAAAKRLGYTDQALQTLFGYTPKEPLFASYKMVDTCGAEFRAETPYFYACYDAECESRLWPRSQKPVVLVLGSGPIRIGQGIEFDYSSVHCVWTVREMGYEAVLVNNNPETVSTDYDTADRLYFEPLCPEDVMNIIRVEKPVGVVVAFGGQTAITLTGYLARQGIPILGTSAEGIDLAEDRERFDRLLETMGIRRPMGRAVQTLDEALSAAGKLGYPVLLRPSYVIGGQNMQIVHDANEVDVYMRRILAQGIENPVLVDKYMPGIELEVDIISDGTDVLIPGVMEHIERAGVHSGDSIAVYPPYNLDDRMLHRLLSSSEKLALALGTRGLVNIQYLIYQGELFVIEVNPRASRTIPYISKVTGVPMVDLASRVMLGESLNDLGYGSGLMTVPPYYAVKAPVFSFEKLNGANGYLGPEMKSTGEVLGIGKTLGEALFKALTASGLRIQGAFGERAGFFLSVDSHDQAEVPPLAQKLHNLGFSLYATEETAATIASLGVQVQTVSTLGRDSRVFDLMESGAIHAVLYTGALADATLGDYIALQRRALQLSIPCLTSLDTANALVSSIASRFTQSNTELVDINRLRHCREKLVFSKMQATGDDYVFLENFDGRIACPESLCLTLCDRHTGIGGFGLVLMENSSCADAKMRVFNRDGSEGGVAGNCIRSVAKYLFDHGIVKREVMTIETGGGVKRVRVYTMRGQVTSASVDMGPAQLETASIPCTLPMERVINQPVRIAQKEWRITCVSMGNPHCVVFCDRPDLLNLAELGPCFENADLFPQRVNTEFVRVVNPTLLEMRVYERGNGETSACGTGACAAVVAAVLNGLCKKETDVTVRVPGGELLVHYSHSGVTLSGPTELVYEGVATY